MQISVYEKNPQRFEIAMHPETAVYLDGEKLEYCVAADDQEGWAKVYKRDSNGELVTDKGKVSTKMLRGEVVIVLPEGVSRQEFESMKIANGLTEGSDEV